MQKFKTNEILNRKTKSFIAWFMVTTLISFILCINICSFKDFIGTLHATILSSIVMGFIGSSI